MSQIQGALIQLFQHHRIVFWYDAKRELRGAFESLILPGVEMIELANNEFGVKYRILREQPEQKFLLYHEGPKPAELENWLLDVELAHGEFRADQAALWLSELGLGSDSLELVQSHPEFFISTERRLSLKAMLTPNDSIPEVRMKMLAVCAGAEPLLHEILEALLDELALEKEEKTHLLRAAGLEPFLWERCERAFGYQSATPGIRDFAIELFKSCYALGLGQPEKFTADAAGPTQPVKFTADALVFVRRWKDSLSHHAAFETLSARYADLLNIQQDLQTQDLRRLVDLDLFSLIDQKILSDLVHSVVDRTISAEDCSTLIRQRRRLHWYPDYQHLYEAVDYAAQFFAALDQSTLAMASLSEGIQRYVQTWHRLDFFYRKVIYHDRKAGQLSLLEPLVTQVENHYTNSYLLKLSNHWQQVVDASPTWGSTPGSGGFAMQRQFFERWVAPFLYNKKKVYVIISDGLRYEAAEELMNIIRGEDRYEGQVEALLATLPSYTQLGMAALLPNRQITFVENDSGTVMVDGINSQGTANRDKLLKQGAAAINHARATAIRSDELLSYNRDAMRDLLRDTDVVYVYHNHIDAVGDKKESEERVFDAVEETLDELVSMIKKLTAANATNLIVTSDHGFIYQNRPLDESDFSSAEPAGNCIYFLDRRFVLGKGLHDQPGLRKYTAAQAGLQGEMEIQVPKAISRLRQKGSGSRYVHGGASLQEVVVPVLSINKKRESDIRKVDVDILRGAASMITSGQFTVAFYQVEPVSDKVKARELRAGIYTLSGKLISDQHRLVFDLASDNPRQREVPVRFILTQESNQANHQEVVLKLEEQVPGTSHYTEYQSSRYTLRRSFTSDFDF